MITVVDAAARSGKHRTTITRAFLSGRLNGRHYPDGTIFIDEDDLDKVFSSDHGYHEAKKIWHVDVPDDKIDISESKIYDLMNKYTISHQQAKHYNDFRDHYQDTADPYPEREKNFSHTPKTKSKKKHNGTRVVFWTDTHVSPGDDLERIRWIANYVKMTNPDHVWHGGDLATFDSCSSHDPIGSRKDKAKPTIVADMDVLARALDIYADELGDTDIPHSFSEGNHEYRLKRFEDSRGTMEGSLYPRMRNAFLSRDWTYHDYGVISFLEGVGFTHIPFNRMGKPYGSHNVMLRDLTHDLVYGHTHQFQKMTQPKLGEQNHVTLLNGGCSLPFNHVEDYAKLNPTGWDYGIIDMTVYDGRILDNSFLSIPTLQRFYESK